MTVRRNAPPVETRSILLDFEDALSVLSLAFLLESCSKTGVVTAATAPPMAISAGEKR